MLVKGRLNCSVWKQSALKVFSDVTLSFRRFGFEDCPISKAAFATGVLSSVWVRSYTRDPSSQTPFEVGSAELLPQVCIVGRPNVGKSMLYNRLVRRKEAVVFDTPGSHVTRDYREGRAQLGDLRFRAIDTSGLEPFLPSSSLQGRASELTARMMRRSDLILLLLDARDGVIPADREVASWMRAQMRPRVIVVVNKCERRTHTGEAENAEALAEAAALGLGDPVAISAAHGEGMAELYAAMQPHIDSAIGSNSPEASEELLSAMGADVGDLKAHPLRLAVVGLPNVGKSTLCNRLIGEERSLTGPEPGLTRDAVAAEFGWDGWRVHLVDTAGWMREIRLDRFDDVGGAVAKLASLDRQRSIRFAHTVALVVDAEAAARDAEGVTRRELSMASDVVEEGRGLLLVLNKLDLVPPARRAALTRSLRRAVQQRLQQVPGLPCVGLSAATGEGVERLMPAVRTVYEEWNQRIGTGELNRWLLKLKARQVGAGSSTGIGRVKYMTQVSRRPPTFSAFVSGRSPMPNASSRYIVNALREDYQMHRVPIRVAFRLKPAVRHEKKSV
mmetsp:Transcript_10873/g.25831  ORF Transcript_10873/g.25831 Transcript_10873/m.25831 type:complete len:559 (+) Transcript_10873:170-1846(+)